MRDKTRELIELCPFRLDNVTEPFARPFVRSVGAFALGVRGGYARARNARARGEREANARRTVRTALNGKAWGLSLVHVGRTAPRPESPRFLPPPHPGRTKAARPPSGQLVEERQGSSLRNARESMLPAGHGGELAPQIAPHIWVMLRFRCHYAFSTRLRLVHFRPSP